jgi:hypothetical protein
VKSLKNEFQKSLKRKKPKPLSPLPSSLSAHPAFLPLARFSFSFPFSSAREAFQAAGLARARARLRPTRTQLISPPTQPPLSLFLFRSINDRWGPAVKLSPTSRRG